MQCSISPDGREFPLPGPEDYKKEWERLQEIATRERENGKEIVVVMGMGFVGIVMAAVIADAEPANGKKKFVFGLQRPSPRSYWKIPVLNNGENPLSTEDPEVGEILDRMTNQKHSFTSTYNEEVLRLADAVVVDVQCDLKKSKLGKVEDSYVEMGAFRNAIKTIGEYIDPKALVLIETTVPPGTTEKVVEPIIRRVFKRRGIHTAPVVAHSYERVMPGRNYVSSIRDFWRVCAGINKESRERCVSFLEDVLNTEKCPLSVLGNPLESETAKVMENSFRAVCIAFSAEWGEFAEQVGVDINKVLDAIRKRPTHKNILFSGPGVGGYCLPKDGGFGMWAHRNFFGARENIFKLTPKAIDINDTRGYHVADLVEEALAELGDQVEGSRVAVLGCAYREDVGDTRYSASELVVRRLAEWKAEVRVHDPYVEAWPEFAEQDHDPHSLARFFENQDVVKNLPVLKDLNQSLEAADAVVFAVRHSPYFDLEPEEMLEICGGPLAVVDCFGILTDEQIHKYLELGCAVRAVSRGHFKRLV